MEDRIDLKNEACLVAVITDGLTSSRLDVYEIDKMRRLERLPGWSRPGGTITGGDGRLWFDVPDAVEHFMKMLGEFERAAEVAYLVPVARGATCALLDSGGGLLPSEIRDSGGRRRRGGVISYLNETGRETERVFDGFAAPLERYRKYGLPPNFGGFTVPGRTLLDLALHSSLQMREARAFAFGPEIMARLACAGTAPAECEGLEPSYLMCHTGLWKDGGWSRLAHDIDGFVVEKTGSALIGGLMPDSPGASSELFSVAGRKAARAFGLLEGLKVLKGGHDSTVADIPAVSAARRELGVQGFIHFQAGSWGMARLVDYGGKAALPDEGFGKNVMLQGDLRGDPVLTASAPTGIEFQHYAGEAEGGRGVFLEGLKLEGLPEGDFDHRTLLSVVSRNEFFVSPGVAKGIGPYPYSEPGVHGMERILQDGAGELARIAVNLETAIMSTASIELATPEGERTPVLLSAGAAADPLFRHLLASLSLSREFYYLVGPGGETITETASDGGFLLALENLSGAPADRVEAAGLGYRLRRIDPDDRLGRALEPYREEFERLAGKH